MVMAGRLGLWFAGLCLLPDRTSCCGVNLSDWRSGWSLFLKKDLRGHSAGFHDECLQGARNLLEDCDFLNMIEE